MRVVLALLILITPLISSAHARLKASAGVAPRSSNAGLKVGPCGSVVKALTAPTLNAGDKLTVTWEETINHPGRYEFRFSTDGDVTWSVPVTVPDTQDGGGLPHQYSTELTLPSVTCDNCTLQMIQVMLDRPTNPSNYYSCADFKLVQSNAPTPTPPPVTTPTPIPGIEDEDCSMSH